MPAGIGMPILLAKNTPVAAASVATRSALRISFFSFIKPPVGFQKIPVKLLSDRTALAWVLLALLQSEAYEGIDRAKGENLT
jgi:hypothetical protein